MKTPVEQAIEALEQGKLCANVAYNLGQHRKDSESILGTVRRFDELRLSALASLKSIKSRLTVDDAMQCVRDWEEYDTRIEHGSAGENEYIDIAGFYLFFSDLQKRLTQSAKP